MKKATLIAVIGIAIILVIDFYYLITNIIEHYEYLGIRYCITNGLQIVGFGCLLYYFIQLYKVVKENK